MCAEQLQYQLDLSQYSCPLPLLMTKKVLKTLSDGARLTLLLNQNASLSDFTLFCQTKGYRWQILDNGKTIAFCIEL